MKDHPATPLVGYAPLTDDEATARARGFREEMARRRTVREFSDRPVPRSVVEQALLTAGCAQMHGFYDLPGGSAAAAELHVARTLVRRAERRTRSRYRRNCPPRTRIFSE